MLVAVASHSATKYKANPSACAFVAKGDKYRFVMCLRLRSAPTSSLSTEAVTKGSLAGAKCRGATGCPRARDHVARGACGRAGCSDTPLDAGSRDRPRARPGRHGSGPPAARNRPHGPRGARKTCCGGSHRGARAGSGGRGALGRPAPPHRRPGPPDQRPSATARWRGGRPRRDTARARRPPTVSGRTPACQSLAMSKLSFPVRHAAPPMPPHAAAYQRPPANCALPDARKRPSRPTKTKASASRDRTARGHRSRPPSQAR